MPGSWIAIMSLLAGCAASEPSPAPVLLDVVSDAPGASGEGFGDPMRAINGVRGGGPSRGGLDVYSLDYSDRQHLTLGLSGDRVIHDGEGPDLVVFENPFRTAAGGHFMDPVVVSVSRDGIRFVELPHAYEAPDPRMYSNDPDHWRGFGGVSPVLLHEEDAPGDPFDPIAAGGDSFDLAELAPEGGEAEAILREGVRFVRLSSAAVAIDPRTGARYPRDPVSNGADIDGVYARWTHVAP